MTQNPAGPLPPPKERRRLRDAASLTRAQVAAHVGVSRATVRAWERGRTAPSGPRAAAYARLIATLASPPTDGRGRERTDDGQRKERSAARVPAPSPAVPSLTPDQAFDALYAFCAPALVRQTYLLTGRRELSREAVERAFQLAWQNWPEVARDRDPGGWIRSTAYEYALSPWHRFRRRHRSPESPPADPADRALLHALLKLPPSYRRTLVLYDGVGLDLPETAAETEASTPAAAGRLTRAREAVAAQVPELADPAALHRRLTELASTERLRATEPTTVRTVGERRNVFWTQAAIAFTAAIVGATALTLHTAPTHYIPPLAPAQAVRGVPVAPAMGPLSPAETALRAKLRGTAESGPQRLVPAAR
ncbi:helix-turn-helix domain-containing protein [Streptomyces sp. NPDC090108]|uniref:helix-turn-helix domain-containing protein n=1 Tax=Streptomyces sp. NPDC090108 TaxID=3365947 RepID=UPI00381BB375